MPDYPLSTVAELLGVSVDTARRWADSGRLKARQSDGRWIVDGSELARFAAEVSEESEFPVIGAQSSRNRFTGIVTRVVKDKVTAQVDLQAGPHRIVSLMTREAADDLRLEPGVLAVAAVKATNVVVELAAEE
ncbi:MAG: TOBE domain-containing protein [Actinomycetota bacterium]|nr:TOBE domain-containing protein [Actinomycetota bacterium]